MGSRTDWLTEFAQPIAKELAYRSGSLKKVLSAGIMALKDLTPEEREYYMSKADGIEMDPLNDGQIEKLWTEMEKLGKKCGVKINKPKRKRG